MSLVEGLSLLGAIAATGLGIAVFFGMFILLPADMAESRGRSKLTWVLVSLVFSPFAAIFLLWVLGRADESSDQR